MHARTIEPASPAAHRVARRLGPPVGGRHGTDAFVNARTQLT